MRGVCVCKCEDVCACKCEDVCVRAVANMISSIIDQMKPNPFSVLDCPSSFHVAMGMIRS